MNSLEGGISRGQAHYWAISNVSVGDERILITTATVATVKSNPTGWIIKLFNDSI